MKRRFLVMTMVALTITIIVVLLLLGINRITSLSHTSQEAITLVSTIAALFGIIFLLMMLHVYFYAHRSWQFTFEGISNESDISQIAHMPINMTELAREELTKQFKEISDELRLCVQRYEKKDYSYRNPDLIARKHKQGPPKYQKADLTEFLVSYGEEKHTLSIRSIREAIVQIVGISPRRNTVGYTMQEIGAGLPQPFQPLAKFVDTLVPPNTVRAIAYLQWQGAYPVQPIGVERKGSAGITLKLEDLGKKQRSAIYTLWQPASGEQKAPHRPAISILWQPTSAQQNKSPEDDHKESSLSYYIQLLRPTMRWLVLLFWENYLFDKQGKRQESAELFYILAALYLYSGKQFDEYKDAFNRYALTLLQQAMQLKPKWFILKMRLGYIYSLFAEDIQEKDEKLRWAKEGIRIFDEALQLAREAEEEQDIQNHIKTLQLYLKLQSDDSQLRQEAKSEYESWVRLYSPTQFDSTEPDLAGLYPYNLACCCVKFHQRDPDSLLLRLAHRYLAYGLARSQRTWLVVNDNPDFEAICKDEGFRKLKKALKKRQADEKESGLPDKNTLPYLQGKIFERRINIILTECGWQ